MSAVPKPVFGISAVLAVVGLAVWILQLSKGLGISGLNQNVVWGMYIAGFFTAASAGAGALALSGIAIFCKDSFDSRDRFSLLSIALSCFIAAGILVAMDIGKISNIFSMIFSFNLSSSMTQDFWALTICVLVTLWGLLKVKSVKPSSIFGIVCIIASLGLITVEGLMLSGISAHAYWGSETVAAFMISMVVAGSAVSLLVLKGKARDLAKKYMVIGLIASALLTFGEILTLGASSEVSTTLELSTTLFGSASIYFWIYVIAGLVVPLVLLAKLQDSNGLRLVGILAVLGVLAEKLWILVVGFELPLVAIPGIESYYVSVAEFFAVIGMAGLGVVAYAVIVGIFGNDSLQKSANMDIQL